MVMRLRQCSQSLLIPLLCFISWTTAFIPTIPKHAIETSCHFHFAIKNENVHSDTSQQHQSQVSRRSFLVPLISAGIIPALILNDPQPSLGKTGQIQTTQYAGRTSTSKVTNDPRVAFDNLLKAREELSTASRILKEEGVDDLRKYLSEEAVNIGDFEGNARAILASKKITDEDKKAIGTIRRYGVGADVMIMYGGLMAEIDENIEEPDVTAAMKFLTRATESLDEVILICRNNGF